MAKIVLSAAGSAGDIFPMIALAAELRARGHAPVMATQAEYRSLIEEQGVGFRALRPSQEDVERALGVDTPKLVRLTTHPSSGLEFAVKRIAMPFLVSSYQDMREACQDAQLVITHTSAFGARLAAEKLDIPWLSAVLAPFAFMSSYDPPLFLASRTLSEMRRIFGGSVERAFLHVLKLASLPWTDTYRRLREELGLSPQANPLFDGQFSPLGTLALYSKHFGSVQRDFPRATTLTGFCYYDGGGLISADVERFLSAGKPPLVFTIGSALVHEPRRFFETAAEATTTLGDRAILLAGSYARQARHLASRDILVTGDYVPHAQIFRRAATVVHHGGIGTTAQALRAGRPQLVVPYSADQPDNADRLERMGVARSIPIGQFNPRRATFELDRLATPAYIRRARRTAENMASENGPAAAADIIERVLAGKGARRFG